MTQKKDFALKLEGCSKADRKKCQELHDSVGGKWDDSDRFNDARNWRYLHFKGDARWYGFRKQDNEVIYSMPADWSEIQEAFGVSVEPKDGEVWIFTNNETSEKFSARVMDIYGKEDNNVYSCILIGGCFSTVNQHSGLPDCKHSKATPEEEQQLIEAEHKNGYHWDGEELVKIPEYVTTLGGIRKLGSYNFKTFSIVGYDGFIQPLFAIKHASTKEAFEAQEAKKEKSNHTIDAFRFAVSGFGESPIKQMFELQCSCYVPKIDLIPFHGRNQYQKDMKKLTERITDLEGENLGYKELLKKREKELICANTNTAVFDSTSKHWYDKYELIKKALADCESAHQTSTEKNCYLREENEKLKKHNEDTTGKRKALCSELDSINLENGKLRQMLMLSTGCNKIDVENMTISIINE